MPNREAIGQAVIRILRGIRLEKCVSMTVMAAKAGLSQSAISLIERGYRNPTLDTLLRIAEVLEVDLDDVLRQAIDEANGRR